MGPQHTKIASKAIYRTSYAYHVINVLDVKKVNLYMGIQRSDEMERVGGGGTTDAAKGQGKAGQRRDRKKVHVTEPCDRNEKKVHKTDNLKRSSLVSFPPRSFSVSWTFDLMDFRFCELRVENSQKLRTTFLPPKQWNDIIGVVIILLGKHLDISFGTTTAVSLSKEQGSNVAEKLAYKKRQTVRVCVTHIHVHLALEWFRVTIWPKV